MLKLHKRESAFVKLGLLLRTFDGQSPLYEGNEEVLEKMENLRETVKNAFRYNGWFIEANVRQMFVSLGKSLDKKKLKKWLAAYLPELDRDKKERTIAVVMAGNIPVVGFHDFLSILMSGNKLLAKLSSDDDKLLPAIAELLTAIEPGFVGKIEFTKTSIKNFDALIATGSDNSARYFQYYFGKYPNIIRKNRNGVAVLTGNESVEELEFLAEDIFSYFGLGCRNVSKIYVPVHYDFSQFIQILTDRKQVIEHHKYFNNYEYNKAIFLVNAREHFDTTTILLVEDQQIASPLSVLNYEYYSDKENLVNQLKSKTEQIQCVVSQGGWISDALPFGKSQHPELWDYADGVDTMDFILGLDEMN